jgi:hypothetical protein
MSSSPTATSATPFTLTAAQNGSAPIPFSLQCTPSPLRQRKPHGVPLLPTMVNSATAGVHHLSAGFSDPLVPLSLPRGVPVRYEPQGPLRQAPHRLTACHCLPHRQGHHGQLLSDPLHPTSFDSKLQQVKEKLTDPSDKHPAASNARSTLTTATTELKLPPRR